jgi:hypothetical protein
MEFLVAFCLVAAAIGALWWAASKLLFRGRIGITPPIIPLAILAMIVFAYLVAHSK